MAAARARGGGDVRERARRWWERAPHGENENGLERKRKKKKRTELDGKWKMGFQPLRAWEVGADWKERKKKLKKKALVKKKVGNEE